jgi:hypothetical protein
VIYRHETCALTPLVEEHLPGQVPDTYPFGPQSKSGRGEAEVGPQGEHIP